MAKLTVTSRGQVTLKKDVLQHLGIKPGDQIDYEKLPGGAIRIQVAAPRGSIEGFIGAARRPYISDTFNRGDE